MSLNLLFAVDHEVLLGLIRCTVWKQIYKKYSWQPRLYKLLKRIESIVYVLVKVVCLSAFRSWLLRCRCWTHIYSQQSASTSTARSSIFAESKARVRPVGNTRAGLELKMLDVIPVGVERIKPYIPKTACKSLPPAFALTLVAGKSCAQHLLLRQFQQDHSKH